jgi:hypothetical protein
VTRGAEGTTPVAHTAGFIVQNVVSAGFFSASVQYVLPSGDTSGVTDAANLAAANNALANGGLIQLGPGQFFVNAAGVGNAGFAPSAQTTATVNGNTFGGNPVSVRGCGAVTVINVVGSCIGLSYHRTAGYGGQFGLPAQPHVGFIKDLTIDLTNAGVGATGLDVGDGWGHDVDVSVQNGTLTQSYTATHASPCVFTVTTAPANGFATILSGTVPTGFTAGQLYYVVARTSTTFELSAVPGGTAINSTTTGSGTHTATIPFRITNRVFWTEKGRFRIQSANNSIAGIMDTLVPGNDISHEYCDWDFTIFCASNQQGIVISGGANVNGRCLHIQGNMANSSSLTATPTNNIAMLTLSGTDGPGGPPPNQGSRLYSTTLRTKVESNQGDGPVSGAPPYGLFSDGNGYIKQTDGRIAHSLTGSVWNGAEFSFSGIIVGDPNLSQLNPTAAGSPGTTTGATPWPGFGVQQQNYGPDATVCVSGGGTTGVSISNQATGLSSGAFFVRAGGSITVNGSGATPSYKWVPATQSQF